MTWIYVWWPTKDYSAMQWPAPDWYHIPSKDEWVTLCWILTTTFSMASNATTMANYLKMVMAGYRGYSSAGVGNQGSDGRYWSSSRDNSNDAYYLYFNSTALRPLSAYYRAYGLSVRCFKNSPVVPDSSWTTLYDGSSVATWAGVFHNATLWLISVSWDGTTWYTIMDKNLWATTVYNSWDTLSESNCGWHFQRWNNYMFPFTWSVTTSWDMVDASTYWPWNYYSSSTFITRSGSPYRWDSTDNWNLRWWVTWVVEKPREVKSIYVWTTPVKEVYVWTTKVRPSADTRTFTITRTEKSDMSSGWTYSDDAAWLTAGSTAFDEFFGYYGCRLNASGVETAKITQEESWWAWKLDITRLWTLYTGDNVMIAFPVMWIKMSKSWSTVTLSITKELNKSWYQYYAHSTWTLSNPWTPKDVFYLGAYKWYSSSNVIKSWSGQSPTVSQTQSTFITRAKANGSGYNIIWYYQRQFINALYMMKYGNPNSQSKVWKWYSGGSAKVNTGWTNSQINATYWTSSDTTQCKLFWLEDWWGNVYEWVWWAYTDSSKYLYAQLSWYSWATSGWENTWEFIFTSWTWNNLSGIAWSNKVLFWPNDTVANSNYNTYYCDIVNIGAPRLAYAGGHWGRGSASGVFSLVMVSNTYGYYNDVGSRLMYL